MRRAALMLCLLMVSGCATPAYRIKKNPELFASFPPEVQEAVRQGRIEVGFTRDMVRMALGAPDRVRVRRTAEGLTEVWVYTGIRHVSALTPVESGYWYRDRRGRLRRGYDWLWSDTWYRYEYEVLRVEFEGDQVRAIESLR